MSRKPLSAKAANLLAQLKSNVTQQEKSQYVESLVENASKRKLAAEAALERKLAKEDELLGNEKLQVFVTRDYQEQVDETVQVLGKEAAGERFVHGEKIDSRASSSTTLPIPQLQLSQPKIEMNAFEQAALLKKRRLERRMARLAPPTRFTKEYIEEAKSRAKIRISVG